MDKNDKMELISAVRAAIEIDQIVKAINMNLVNVMRLKPELVSRCEAAGLNCEIEYETGSVVVGEMAGGNIVKCSCFSDGKCRAYGVDGTCPYSGRWDECSSKPFPFKQSKPVAPRQEDEVK